MDAMLLATGAFIMKTDARQRGLVRRGATD
jgi:hypothetical protein